MTPTGCDADHVVTARVTWVWVCASRTPGLERLLVAAGGVACRDTACWAPGADLGDWEAGEVGGTAKGPQCLAACGRTSLEMGTQICRHILLYISFLILNVMY